MEGGRPKAGDEIDRTERDEPDRAIDEPSSDMEFGVPGSPAEEPPDGHENDFA